MLIQRKNVTCGIILFEEDYDMTMKLQYVTLTELYYINGIVLK